MLIWRVREYIGLFNGARNNDTFQSFILYVIWNTTRYILLDTYSRKIFVWKGQKCVSLIEKFNFKAENLICRFENYSRTNSNRLCRVLLRKLNVNFGMTNYRFSYSTLYNINIVIIRIILSGFACLGPFFLHRLHSSNVK